MSDYIDSWFTFSLGGILKSSFYLVVAGTTVLLLCYALKRIYGLKSTYEMKKLVNNNTITIIHTTSFLKIVSDASITIKTHMDFIKAYEKMDKERDIHIVMHTVGGILSSAEAICNCIANHKLGNHKGKTIVYIPYYSYSGGCMIALACDKIVMSKNAILGPCDAQQYVKGIHSVASIIDTVSYKKEMKEKIDEEWLAGCYDANLCKERQAKYIDKLVKSGNFTEEIGKVIYEEFFSGKYNHDKMFSAQDAQLLGLNIEIVDVMPDIIKNITNDITD